MKKSKEIQIKNITESIGIKTKDINYLADGIKTNAHYSADISLQNALLRCKNIAKELVKLAEKSENIDKERAEWLYEHIILEQ